MPPTIYVVRHAQGHHNVNNRHHLRDPHITDLGRTQCSQLSSTFPSDINISCVMASPLIRTIETACLSFTSLLRREEVPFVLVPMAQEIANQGCDIGYAPEELKERVKGWLEEEKLDIPFEKIDWGLVHEGWNSKQGPYFASLSAVEARAATLRAWLYTQPYDSILLVSHGAFLHYFSEDWTFFDGAKGTAYENCEWRRFEFSGESSAEEAHLVEHGGEKVKLGRPKGVHGHVLEGIAEIEGIAPRGRGPVNGKK